jgi:Tol biopolymer transport system component
MKRPLIACLLLTFNSAVPAASNPPEGTYTVSFASFGPTRTDLFIARGDGSGVRPLLSETWNNYNAALSHDGKWMTFTSERDGSPDIYRMRIDGRGRELLVGGTAFDDQGVLSPDGNRLAFVSDRSGQPDIWVLNLKTRALTNVTQHPGGDFRPAWSPDGKWLAFSSDRDSTNPRPSFSILHSTAIYMVRPDGRDLRLIGKTGEFEGSPSWSRDGKTVVFYQTDIANVNSIVNPKRLRGTTQLMAINIASGERTVLTEGPGEKTSPHWITDKKLAYISGGPEGGLSLMTAPTVLRGEVNSPSWSANGKRMVFHRDAAAAWPPFQRWRSLDPAFKLLRTGVFPSWLPSGKTIVLNDKTAGILHNNIISIAADGKGERTLFHDEKRSALAPEVSPNGKQIAFGLGRFFQNTQGRAMADIAVINMDGTGLTILTDGSGNYGLPSWSPDGSQIVFRGAGNGEGKDGLLIIDLASNAVRHIPGTIIKDNFPSWSPKGDLISFTSNRDGDYEIYTVRPDGSGLKRLTNIPGNDAHNSWSPDGEWIAFASGTHGFRDEAVLHPYNPQPYGEIYVMRADGSDRRRLTNNQYEEGTPKWAPAVPASLANP